jgi:hypothetical protein
VASTDSQMGAPGVPPGEEDGWRRSALKGVHSAVDAQRVFSTAMAALRVGHPQSALVVVDIGIDAEWSRAHHAQAHVSASSANVEKCRSQVQAGQSKSKRLS